MANFHPNSEIHVSPIVSTFDGKPTADDPLRKPFKKDNTASIVEIADEGSHSDESSPCVQQSRDANSTNQRKRFNKASFPIKGFIGLVGSALTILCSWAVLYASKDTQVWTERYPTLAKVLQPASALAAIIAVNSILLHMAFSEGASIAWWLRATRSKATVGELHDTWKSGSGILDALKASRRFNHLALATIVIALIPINGVLLQGALITYSWYFYLGSSNIDVPFVNNFVSGMSGSLTSDGSLNIIDSSFSASAYNFFATSDKQYVVMRNKLDPDLVLPQDQDNQSTGCKNTCSFNAPGVGFRMACTEDDSSIYDFTVNTSIAGWENDPIVTTGLPIYQINFNWTVDDPNTIAFNLLSKQTFDCSGTYNQLACTLTATKALYPAILDVNNTAFQQGSTLTIDYSVFSDNDTESSSGNSPEIWQDPIPADDENASHMTKFGYFSQIFNDYFGSKILVKYSNTNGTPVYTLSQNGIFANAPYMAFGPDAVTNADGTVNLTGQGADGCQVFINSALDSLEDDSNDIFDNIRNFMFLLSYEKALDPFVNTSLLADQFETQTLYGVVWWHWGASLAVTFLVVLCVTPTFWGFWMLTRVPTMSPLEMARAFDAPVLADQQKELATEEMLENIRGRALHSNQDRFTTN